MLKQDDAARLAKRLSDGYDIPIETATKAIQDTWSVIVYCGVAVDDISFERFEDAVLVVAHGDPVGTLMLAGSLRPVARRTDTLDPYGDRHDHLAMRELADPCAPRVPPTI